MTILDVYKSWLDKYGIKYEETPDYLAFYHQDVRFIIGNNADDPQFFNIIMPRVFVFAQNPKVPRGRVLEALNKVNHDFKVVKGICDDEECWFTTEMFIASGTNIDEYSERLVYILFQSFLRFRELIEGK